MSGPGDGPRARPRRPSTRYARLAPAPARGILVALAALVALGLLRDADAGAERAPVRANLDADLYRAIVERVHAGDGYYEAAGDELRARHYATRPFWNWRLPTLAWLTGHLPRPEAGRWLLATAALATLVAWVHALRRDAGLPFAMLGGVLLAGPLVSGASDRGFLFHEVWAGIGIALSLGLHAAGLRGAAVAAGLAALLVRELALPFAAAMALCAGLERRGREAALWLAALLAFGVAIAVHAGGVGARLGPDELVNDPWLRFGGWSFVLETARWNPYLLAAPAWCTAWWLPLCLLGLLGWPGDVGRRAALAVLAYVGAFLVAGRADNDYWGLVYVPLASLGLAFAPAALLDLVRAARPGPAAAPEDA